MAEGRIKWYSHHLGHGFIVCVRGRRGRQPNTDKAATPKERNKGANQDLHD
jgi:hypothetical protein